MTNAFVFYCGPIEKLTEESGATQPTPEEELQQYEDRMRLYNRYFSYSFQLAWLITDIAILIWGIASYNSAPLVFT